MYGIRYMKKTLFFSNYLCNDLITFIEKHIISPDEFECLSLATSCVFITKHGYLWSFDFHFLRPLSGTFQTDYKELDKKKMA